MLENQRKRIVGFRRSNRIYQFQWFTGAVTIFIRSQLLHHGSMVAEHDLVEIGLNGIKIRSLRGNLIRRRGLGLLGRWLSWSRWRLSLLRCCLFDRLDRLLRRLRIEVLRHKQDDTHQGKSYQQALFNAHFACWLLRSGVLVIGFGHPGDQRTGSNPPAWNGLHFNRRKMPRLAPRAAHDVRLLASCIPNKSAQSGRRQAAKEKSIACKYEAGRSRVRALCEKPPNFTLNLGKLTIRATPAAIHHNHPCRR